MQQPRGQFVGGDYFINIYFASLSLVRGVFGGWIHVFIAVVAVCFRKVYRSRLKGCLLSDKPHERQVSLWRMSPSTSVFEVYRQRHTLLHAFRRGQYSFAFVSLFTIAATLISAASTSIANRAVVANIITMQEPVPGRLVTHGQGQISGFVSNVTARIRALDAANAPLDQFFDFVPDDGSSWIFVAEQWNNSWRGNCSFHKYPAVDLILYATNSTAYQDEVPALGLYIPQWATVDPDNQARDFANYVIQAANGSLIYQDNLVTYAFGTVPDVVVTTNYSTVNLSFANYLAHNIPTGGVDTFYTQASIKSDVHVFECVLNNSMPGAVDQARVDGGDYENLVASVADVYRTHVLETSIAGQPITQPTGQEMLRYLQAFLSVKDALFLNPVQRTLSVRRPVVQIRASALFTTTIFFLFALLAVFVCRQIERRDEFGNRLTTPSTQMDWMAQAALEHFQDDDYQPWNLRKSDDFLRHHDDLAYVVSTGRDGRQAARIVALRKVKTPFTEQHNVTEPFLDYFDPLTLYDSHSTLKTP